MKLLVSMMAVALLLSGCELGRIMMEQPSDRAKRLHVDESSQQDQANEEGRPKTRGGSTAQDEASEPRKPKSNALLEKHTEVFTGKVVLDNGAYRLELLDEPGTLVKLTRARRETEFEAEQILLRKYYEKTITVNGTRQDDWIWGADITGQYVPPGGPTGPNMNAPKQSRP